MTEHRPPSNLPIILRDRPALLVVAHPGHELRVHAWLEMARPEVWVLTDGTGHGAPNRLPSTRRRLHGAAARPGPVFGAFSDRAAYDMLLAGEVGPWAAIARRLAERLTSEEAPYVVADALEGFNPVHDLCRVLVDTAVVLAERQRGTVLGFDFPLEASPDVHRVDDHAGDVRLVLDENALARKIAAARADPDMAAEVERALATHGEQAFAVERLRAVRPLRPLAEQLADPALYERYGEQRVAAGHYGTVLRLGKHFVPFADELRRLVLEV
ncbi:MAG TPA: hypothetical protein VHQ65_16265 [Thermoanaerobaculia bacterium]|nr:hypothetical protein [Thermoanaerobaculia bacterium]